MKKDVAILPLPEGRKDLVNILNNERFVVEDVSYQTASDGGYIRTSAIVTYSIKENEKDVAERVWTEALEKIFTNAFYFGISSAEIQDENSKRNWYVSSLDTVKKNYIEGEYEERT